MDTAAILYAAIFARHVIYPVSRAPVLSTWKEQTRITNVFLMYAVWEIHADAAMVLKTVTKQM
jgi:hypothetical protein